MQPLAELCVSMRSGTCQVCLASTCFVRRDWLHCLVCPWPVGFVGICHGHCGPRAEWSATPPAADGKTGPASACSSAQTALGNGALCCRLPDRLQLCTSSSRTPAGSVPMTVDSRVPTAPEKDQTQKHYRHSAQVWIPGRPAHFSTTFAANYSYASASSNTPLPVRATARRFRQEFSQRRVSAIIRVARSHRQLQQAPRVHSQCGERCDGRPSGRQQQCEPESPERKDSELLVEYIEFRPAGKAVITTVTNFKLDVQNFRGLQTSTRTLHCGCNLSNRAVWTHTHTHITVVTVTTSCAGCFTTRYSSRCDWIGPTCRRRVSRNLVTDETSPPCRCWVLLAGQTPTSFRLQADADSNLGHGPLLKLCPDRIWQTILCRFTLTSSTRSVVRYSSKVE